MNINNPPGKLKHKKQTKEETYRFSNNNNQATRSTNKNKSKNCKNLKLMDNKHIFLIQKISRYPIHHTIK